MFNWLRGFNADQARKGKKNVFSRSAAKHARDAKKSPPKPAPQRKK